MKWFIELDVGEESFDHSALSKFRAKLGEKIYRDIFEDILLQIHEVGLLDPLCQFMDATSIYADMEKEIIHLKEEARKMLEEARTTDAEEDSLSGNANPYTQNEKVSSLLNHIETLERAYEEIGSGEESAEAGEKDAEAGGEEREEHAREKAHESTAGNEKEQNKEKEPKINTTDFDAHIMQLSDKTLRPAYNGEVAVDGEENVIIACHLTDEAIDHQQLQPLVEHAQDNGIHPDNLGTDAGYFSYDNAAYLEEKGITGYIPDNFFRKEEKKETKKFRKSQFQYDESTDIYTCPAGNTLSFHHIQKREGAPDLRLYKGSECLHCPLKEKCTTAEYRSISRDPREYLTERMRSRLKTEKGQKMKKERSTKVESVFGNMKHNKKFTQFLLRGKEFVAIEFVLMCTVLNIEKIFTHLVTHQKDIFTAMQGIT
ncbi:MAG: IS1182 family transposase [Theionarchaea archaeon]|nr:IS1182 family transposase [Theionarchaea archaeon]